MRSSVALLPSEWRHLRDCQTAKRDLIRIRYYFFRFARFGSLAFVCGDLCQTGLRTDSTAGSTQNYSIQILLT